MSVPVYQIELLEFRFGLAFATVRLQKLDLGMSAEWWVSRNFGTGVQVCGSLVVPVLGEGFAGAEQECELRAQEVIDFMCWAGTGISGVPGAADEYRRAHARAHLAEQREFLSGLTVTEQTAALYEFAVQFNVSNPAALIASVEGLSSVRTVHDRLEHARRLGILERPGRGNKRSVPSSSRL